jgi:hypothetical protein
MSGPQPLRSSDGTRAFLDAMFVPTLVPLQTGRNNYVDNDRISTAAGFDYDFKAFDSRGRPIPSAAGLQTNNPGWPGFASSGMLFGGGVNLALLL